MSTSHLSIFPSLKPLSSFFHFVVPKKLPYSYREQKIKLKDESGGKKEREAFLVGLGDMIIPGFLASSAFWFISISDA